MDNQIKEIFEEELREKEKEIEAIRLNLEHKKKLEEKQKEIYNLLQEEKNLPTFEDQKRMLAAEKQFLSHEKEIIKEKWEELSKETERLRGVLGKFDSRIGWKVFASLILLVLVYGSCSTHSYATRIEELNKKLAETKNNHELLWKSFNEKQNELNAANKLNEEAKRYIDYLNKNYNDLYRQVPWFKKGKVIKKGMTASQLIESMGNPVNSQVEWADGCGILTGPHWSYANDKYSNGCTVCFDYGVVDKVSQCNEENVDIVSFQK